MGKGIIMEAEDLVTPEISDIPEDEGAEPEDADVSHTASDEELEDL